MMRNNIRDFKTMLFFIVCFFLVSCNSQVKLVHSVSEVKYPITDTLQIKRVRSAFRSDSLVVRLKDRRKLIFSPNAVWGVKYNSGTIYRYFKGQFYYVRQFDSLSIYSQTHAGYKSSHTHYYFSKNPTADIYGLNWKNLKREFVSDSCFLNTVDISLKWYQDYSSFDKANGSYRIVEFYKACNRK